MTNDLVSDMLTRIRNASLARHTSGIMSHLKATKLKKGGEILCYIG